MPPQLPELILASSSPQRRALLAAAGYRFRIEAPGEDAESGECGGETPGELAARMAYQKAADVAGRVAEGLVLACDTVVECGGQVLGKPADREHARQMLTWLSGREHRVWSGVCLWRRPDDWRLERRAMTRLRMDTLEGAEIEAYLDAGLWAGKAGAFGYQDRAGWLHVLEGSESNVVGLPLELLAEMAAELPAEESGRGAGQSGGSSSG
jgi:septum formation protein